MIQNLESTNSKSSVCQGQGQTPLAVVFVKRPSHISITTLEDIISCIQMSIGPEQSTPSLTFTWDPCIEASK